jgi:hypothetical protein
MMLFPPDFFRIICTAPLSIVLCIIVLNALNPIGANAQSKSSTKKTKNAATASENSATSGKMGGSEAKGKVGTAIKFANPPLEMPPASDTTFLPTLMKSKPEQFDSILANPARYRVQILYTQIDRDKRNRPAFTSYSYRLDPKEYFYPASTVKFPTALMALEKMNALKLPVKSMPMRIDSVRPDQTPVRNDVSSSNGTANVAHYVKKIMLVSDNDAHNRLLEFVGPDELNNGLYAKGYRNVKINRRLSVGSSPEQDQYSNPVQFFELIGGALYTIRTIPLRAAKNEYFFDGLRDLKQGRGVMRRDTLVNEPIDFAPSNYIALSTLQKILRNVIFPEVAPEKERFNLTPDDYDFLYTAMAMFPRESKFPKYDTSYHDGYVKFFMYGTSNDTIPRHIRIFNKVGDAYGYLIDNAYIADFQNNIEFFVSAIIHVNSDGIFNDNKYEYDEIGFPFLANLGRLLYEYELTRKRANPPNLSKFSKYQTPIFPE